MTALGPAGSDIRRDGGPQISTPGIDEIPESFRSALGELRRAKPRQAAQVGEIPAPVKLAPYAVALRADVFDPTSAGPSGSHSTETSSDASGAELLAAGRFILLHDPAGQETWGGTFRVVIYIRAELDAEMADDPLLAEVAWTWLSDSLDQCGVERVHTGGTATRILSQSFGSLQDRPASRTVELRASWTPADSRIGGHLEAWADMVCSFAGLPPLPDGVVALPHVRRN